MIQVKGDVTFISTMMGETYWFIVSNPVGFNIVKYPMMPVNHAVFFHDKHAIK